MTRWMTADDVFLRNAPAAVTRESDSDLVNLFVTETRVFTQKRGISVEHSE